MTNRWVPRLAFGLLGSAVALAQTPTPVPAPQQAPVFRARTAVVPVT